MPFTKPSEEELDRIANEVLALLRHQDHHPLAKPQGMTFSQIERTAHVIGQRVAARLTAEALVDHADQAFMPQVVGGIDGWWQSASRSIRKR